MNHKLKLAMLPLLAIGFIGTPAYAQAETAELEQSEEENLDENICRRVHVTGTRIPQRVCMTRREWISMSNRSREDTQRAATNENANISVTGGPNSDTTPIIDRFQEQHGVGQ